MLCQSRWLKTGTRSLRAPPPGEEEKRLKKARNIREQVAYIVRLAEVRHPGP